MSEKSASKPRAASEVLSGHSLCKKFQFTIVRVFYDDRWNMYTNLNKNLRLLLSAIVFFSRDLYFGRKNTSTHLDNHSCTCNSMI